MMRTWRRRLSNLMILAGAFLLLAVGLFSLRTALAGQSAGAQPYLASSGRLDLPLPALPTATLPPTPTPTLLPTLLPTEILEASAPGGRPTAPVGASPTAFVPGQPSQNIGAELQQTPGEAPTAAVKVIKLANQRVFNPLVFFQQPDPSQASLYPQGSPVVRIGIESLTVERAVVPIDMVPGKQGDLNWDTDSLFANRNRDDLVGQVAVSLNPGEGGNIILVGHNTNVGWDWAGVFYNLAELQPGAEIILYTEDGGEFRYVVELVKKVPWKRQSEAELLKHQRFLFPTESEQLTLVTCGGVFTTQYSARIYVVALPAP